MSTLYEHIAILRDVKATHGALNDGFYSLAGVMCQSHLEEIASLLDALEAMVADHRAIQCKPWPSFENAVAVIAKARPEPSQPPYDEEN